ncbi:hypothetical protein BVG16_04815 [Paenibacillus selenitireducens]|uniref:Calcineurin-like phosphoesterase domain-containing protein n=2 Tax=Paenibacillus selenitireducens TaxID=1324314 RepID=A0A1T2XJS9_9BACL|nr:hypothetical protein BVG16_04815 [Paenibacillus selenitireducens]
MPDREASVVTGGNMGKHKISRRTFLKRTVLSLFGLALTGGAYTRFVEPIWFEVQRLNLQSKRLPDVFHNLRILHISDIHFGFHMNAERLQKIVHTMNQEHADVICFTGDLIDDGFVDVSSAIPVLKQLNAPFGKFAVLGNHDYRHTTPEKSIDALKQAGFIVLNNAHVELQLQGQKLAIVGLEDWFGGKPNLEVALRGLRDDQYKILMAHEPDLADKASHYPVDLQLSGHSHGGQIRIPWMHSSPWNPIMGIKYPSGLYTFPHSDFKLYTNRGLGMTFMPIRFLCRPEITVITLQNSHHT